MNKIVLIVGVLVGQAASAQQMPGSGVAAPGAQTPYVQGPAAATPAGPAAPETQAQTAARYGSPPPVIIPPLVNQQPNGMPVPGMIAAPPAVPAPK